ncbi:hypothetical protein MM213_20235 [Belliella sp. R4-6]|uniref:Uncharacterized protein n=1 Tax=Belliella alkalica TaxID=1730871 RepID=A0ABS9VIN8_9BACT|nr:hypothetical protein [Belliella alkalica]MCH7415840.1 hypothetical protein [Belliella alkalica]
MKKILLQTFLLLVVFSTFAQNPALEFAAGDGNPTGNGPVTSTTIRFRNNTDNPTGNTFATYNPALNVNVALTNQQYLNHPQNTNGNAGNPNNPSSVIGWFFGSNVADPIFPLLNFFSDPVNSNFTSSGNISAGTGIAVASNRGVAIANGLTVLNGLPFAGKHWMHDIVITFNRPVNNPVLHFMGLGGSGAGSGFTAELDLLTTGLTLNRLSGTPFFSVAGNQILNTAAEPRANGAGVAHGSVLVQGDQITSLTFRVFVRGQAGVAGTNWGAAGVEDGWILTLSSLESNLSVTKTVNNPTPNVGENVIFTVTATNNGPSNDTGVNVQDLLPSGYTYVSHTVSAGGGTYTPGTGLWNIGNLNNGVTRTLSITATVNASGNYTNVATISGTNSDPILSNNQASIDVVPFPCPSSINRVTNGVFPTTGGNTNTVPGWIVGGTYAPSGPWASPTGRVQLNANGLEFRRDVNTVTTLSQNLTNINGLTTISLNDFYWFRTLRDTNAGGFTFTVSYAGTIYATVSSTTVDATTSPSVAGNNGATVNISSLPLVASQTSRSSNSNLVIVLPSGIPQSGALLFTFTANSDPTEVRDIGMRSVEVKNCPFSDLSVTKTVNNPVPSVGSNIVFTVTATNNGPNNDTGVQVQDLLPNGYSYVSHTVSADGGTYTPGTGLWNIGNLNNGVSRTLSITATVNASGNYTNVATISGDNGDSNLNNNEASVITNPLIPFNCGDNRLFLNQAVVASDPSILFDIERSNNPFIYTPIDNGSHGITYNAIGYNSQDNFVYGIRESTNQLVVIDATGIPINLGAVTGLPLANYLSGDFDEDGFLYVHSTGTTSNSIFKINVATRTVVQTISLFRNVIFFDLAYNPVDGFLYTVLGNTDPSAPGRIWKIDRNTGAVVALGPTPSSTVNFGALFIDALGNFYGVANNGSGFYQFDLTTGQRTVISGAPSSSLNDGAICASSILTFDTDLRVTKTDGSNTYTPGSNVVYTIVVTNAGPFGATNVLVSDPLIAGIPAANHSYTASVSGGATTSVSGTQNGAINDVVNIPVGGTVTYTLTVSVPAGFTGSMTNTVTVTPPSNINDIDLSNNEATDINNPLSDLSIAKTVNNPTPNVGEQVIFTITATNNGPSTDTNVIVEDVLSSGYTFVSAAPSVGTWSGSTWAIGNLANGASVNLQIIAEINVVGEHTNTATISGDNDDPSLSNNEASVSTTTVCNAGDAQVPLSGSKTNNQ